MKYAIYALCVNSHRHSQCQECKDGPSEDLAAAAEPVNDSLSSPGAAPPPTPSLVGAGNNLSQQVLCVGTLCHQGWEVALVLLCPRIISSIYQPL